MASAVDSAEKTSAVKEKLQTLRQECAQGRGSIRLTLEDLALLLASQGRREFPVEYFEPDTLARARAWLSEPTAPIPAQFRSPT